MNKRKRYLQQILRAKNIDDVMTCYDSLPSREKYLELLTIQCMNLRLPIPNELFTNLKFRNIDTCYLIACSRDDVEYFKFFLPFARKRFDYVVMPHVDISSILQYSLENDIQFCEEHVNFSNPSNIEILEKFNVPRGRRNNETFLWDGYFNSKEIQERILRRFNIPCISEYERYFSVPYRTIIDIMLTIDMRDSDMFVLDYLDDSINYPAIISFLREGEYEIIFNKIGEVRPSYIFSKSNRPTEDPFVLRIRRYMNNPRGKYSFHSMRIDSFRKNYLLWGPREEEFLIRDHLPWLKENIEMVIKSGKMRLIEAIRKER